MEVCKNKSSGKYFIFIEEKKMGIFLLVIPSGEVKLLDPSLFEEPVEINEDHALSSGFLSQNQLHGYKKFIEEDSLKIFRSIMSADGDPAEKLVLAFNELSFRQREYVAQVLFRNLEKETKRHGKTDEN